MYKQIFSFGLAASFLLTVCVAVRITNFKVPSVYLIDKSEETKPLILDCEYEVDANETGFVLKWLLNDVSVYQWIPTHKPYASLFMKGRVDLNYSASKEKYQKHRAVYITHPIVNMTGEYTCYVQTFQTKDKMKGKLQMIVPEADFNFRSAGEDEEKITYECSVTDVYPEPRISLIVDDTYMADETTNKSDKNGLYDLRVTRQFDKDSLASPANLHCVLTLLGTNYTKREEVLFYNQQHTSTTMVPIKTADISSETSRLEGETKGNATKQTNLSSIILSTLLTVILTNFLKSFNQNC